MHGYPTVNKEARQSSNGHDAWIVTLFPSRAKRVVSIRGLVDAAEIS